MNSIEPEDGGRGVGDAPESTPPPPASDPAPSLKECVAIKLGSRLGKCGRSIYFTLADQIVTWGQIRRRCGLSDHEISIGWQSLLNVGLAEGDITWNKEGMVFAEPIRWPQEKPAHGPDSPTLR